jgi:hypothetical protein
MNGIGPIGSKRPRGGRIACALALSAVLVSPALACNQELAVYSEKEGAASIEFQPVPGQAATSSHRFRMVFAENDVVFDGVVMWSEGVARSNGIVMHNCPEGDVTGDELAACTIWQGVIYSVDEFGGVDLLPAEGANAATQLLFPDLGPSVRHSFAYGMDGLTKMPWDVFKLSGCQE